MTPEQKKQVQLALVDELLTMFRTNKPFASSYDAEQRDRENAQEDAWDDAIGLLDYVKEKLAKPPKDAA